MMFRSWLTNASAAAGNPVPSSARQISQAVTSIPPRYGAGGGRIYAKGDTRRISSSDVDAIQRGLSNAFGRRAPTVNRNIINDASYRVHSWGQRKSRFIPK